MKAILFIFAFLIVFSLSFNPTAFAAVNSAKYKEIFYPDGLPEKCESCSIGDTFKFEYRFLLEYPVPGTDKIFVAYDLYNTRTDGFNPRTHWARVGVLEKKQGKITLKKKEESIAKHNNGYHDHYELKAYFTSYEAYKGTKGVILFLYCKGGDGGSEDRYADAYIYLTNEKEPLEQSFTFPYILSKEGRVDLYLIPPDKNGRAGFATRKLSGNMKQKGFSVYGFLDKGEPCECYFEDDVYERGYRLIENQESLPKNARKIKLPQLFEEADR